MSDKIYTVDPKGEELIVIHAQYGAKTITLPVHFVEKSALDAANKRIESLESALQGLLNDTQHSDHDCGDERCPVEDAREALLGKESK